MSDVKRYHPALVVLHWLLALAIFGVFIVGAFVLDDMKNDVPQKVLLLKLHVLGGLTILVLTAVRLLVRMKTARPAPVVTDNPKMDKIGTGVQHLLYALTLLAAISGMVLASKHDLLAILFKGAGALPESFEGAAHSAHGLMAMGLILFSLVHIAGALKHQFVLKNNLLDRMKLGK